MLGLFRSKQSEIRIEDLENFLNNEFRQDIDSTLKKLSRIEDQIFFGIDNLKKSFDDLNSIDSSNTFTKNLKNKYCRRALDSISVVQRSGNTYPDKKKFIDSCVSAVNEISRIDIKEFRHLGAFNIKMSKISAQIRQINGMCSSYNSALNGSGLEDIFTAASMFDKLNKKYERYALLSQELATTEKSAEFIKAKAHSFMINAEEAKKNAEEIDAKKPDISEDERQKNTIEISLSTELGSIERSLRKFMHDCESIIEKTDIEMMKKYLNDPGSTFLFHDDGSVLKRNLIKMREAMQRGDFTTDDKTEKVDRMIRSMDFYLSMKQQHQGLARSIEKFYKKLEDLKKPFITQKQALADDIEKISLEISHLEDGAKKKRSEIAILKKEINHDIEKIDAWVLKKCGRKIVIKHSFDLG
ncbi:MAG: hypothetical protein QMD85_00750 [Candidatus Aenigmarchaeota archaeon]|nr:hypothetical protein [Candidatus Aenigmarchaeota archaeon]MDI6722066.1 hypothetical protein [Candidatus Aenigmarchaeota archaeon]